LTWTSRVVFVFDKELNLVKELKLPSQIKEGWGLTHDDDYLYDAETFSVVHSVAAQDSRGF
jgi:glutamine cyclotransferase